MFFYRYKEIGKEWSEMLTETSFRRCIDNLYTGIYEGDIEYEIYESNLIDKDVIKMNDEYEDEYSMINEDHMEYLKLIYLDEGDPMDYLDCRVPFDYKNPKYNEMRLIDYIIMIDKIEKEEDEEIFKIIEEDKKKLKILNEEDVKRIYELESRESSSDEFEELYQTFKSNE